MEDPNEDGDPSHYVDRYTGGSDNGGVHINSGIANHWFYLLVEGGQNADATFASGTKVQGIGMASAEQIAFLGFTSLTANATFCDARASTIAMADGNATNVADAWDEVGVDDALCNGGSTGGGGGSGSTGSDLVISDVASRKVNSKNGRFEVTWTTNIPATTVVTFDCCGSRIVPERHFRVPLWQWSELQQYFRVPLWSQSGSRGPAAPTRSKWRCIRARQQPWSFAKPLSVQAC